MASIATRTTDTTFVPSTFDDMYRHYYDYVVALVKRRGILDQNADDVAQSILLKFWEVDALADFDPTRIVSSGRPSVFGSFLGGFVYAYLPKHRERQERLHDNEFHFVDEPGHDWEHSGVHSPWLDFKGYMVEDDVTDIEEQEMSRIIRARLMLAQPVNTQDRCDLLALFEQIRQQTTVGEKISTGALAEHFGVTTITMRSWLRRLRTEVDAILEEG